MFKRISKFTWAAIALFFFLVFIGLGDWEMPGADEKVGEIAGQYAREVGAEERPPYINTDRGDLLLFVFALGGGISGFWLGYNWRDLLTSGKNL